MYKITVNYSCYNRDILMLHTQFMFPITVLYYNITSLSKLIKLFYNKRFYFLQYFILSFFKFQCVFTTNYYISYYKDYALRRLVTQISCDVVANDGDDHEEVLDAQQ